MIERREEKDEAGLAEALDGKFGAELDGHAESFEDVGRAAERGDGAVAVLGDLGSGGGSYQRRAAGDVECERTSAAGADSIDELVALGGREGQRRGVPTHHLDKANQFRHLFATGCHRSQQRCSFYFRHATGKYFFQHASRLHTSQRRPLLSQSAYPFRFP